MAKAYKKGTISFNKEIASNIFELKLKIKDMEEKYIPLGQPGQFFMLRGWEANDPFLPRPISIADVVDDTITFLYEVRGKGTHIISKLKEGDTLEVLGPLGNGFDLNIEGKVAIVAGGIGIAPMKYLSKSLDNKIDFYSGFRSQAYYEKEIKEYVDNIYISTEDGSTGHKGFVTELFDPKKYDMVLSCGPIPMMEKLGEICKDIVPLQISMESRMACGIGACLGCTIETKKGIERVCKDGPVFFYEEVSSND